MPSPSAAHLAPQGGGFEPSRVFNWDLVITGIADTETVRLSVERVQMPRESVAVMHLRYFNEDVKVAGGASVGDNSIVVRDFIDRRVLATLKAWFQQVHNWEDGKSGYASEYKKQAIVRLCDPKGDVKRQVIAIGVFPSSLSYSDLDYNTDNGQVKLMMTLQVDRWRMEF